MKSQLKFTFLDKYSNNLLNNCPISSWSIQIKSDKSIKLWLGISSALNRKPKIFNSYNEFLDIEASGWKGRAKTAIKCYPKITEYYRSLINNFFGINNCEINLLGVDKEYIAGQFCVYVDDTCYLLKIGYKEEYSRYAPGNILLENLIKRVTEENKIKYISLVTGSTWHNDWKPENYKVYRIFSFNKTFAGFFAFVLSKAKQTARPLLNQMS